MQIMFRLYCFGRFLWPCVITSLEYKSNCHCTKQGCITAAVGYKTEQERLKLLSNVLVDGSVMNNAVRRRIGGGESLPVWTLNIVNLTFESRWTDFAASTNTLHIYIYRYISVIRNIYIGNDKSLSSPSGSWWCRLTFIKTAHWSSDLLVYIISCFCSWSLCRNSVWKGNTPKIAHLSVFSQTTAKHLICVHSLQQTSTSYT